jgi:hypothetical protein
MAKNSKRKRTDRQKAHYDNYKVFRTEEKNRIRKLARHVNNFPIDLIAFSKLEDFRKEGVPHRRKNRSVGIKLTEHMQKVLKHKGKRLTSYKVKILGGLNNPASLRPASSMNLDLLMNILSGRTRVKYKTAMRVAYEKAYAN